MGWSREQERLERKEGRLVVEGRRRQTREQQHWWRRLVFCRSRRERHRTHVDVPQVVIDRSRSSTQSRCLPTALQARQRSPTFVEHHELVLGGHYRRWASSHAHPKTSSAQVIFLGFYRIDVVL